MDQVENVIRSATAKSRDGRIDVTDFLNEAAGSMRYGVFTPMEVRETSVESVARADRHS
jgi:solute carrier family 25 (mitochondrial aspartate/glutamate transporter), member 12/13